MDEFEMQLAKENEPEEANKETKLMSPIQINPDEERLPASARSDQKLIMSEEEVAVRDENEIVSRRRRGRGRRSKPSAVGRSEEVMETNVDEDTTAGHVNHGFEDTEASVHPKQSPEPAETKPKKKVRRAKKMDESIGKGLNSLC